MSTVIVFSHTPDNYIENESGSLLSSVLCLGWNNYPRLK